LTWSLAPGISPSEKPPPEPEDSHIAYFQND
jgi:hypothetical protein